MEGAKTDATAPKPNAAESELESDDEPMDLNPTESKYKFLIKLKKMAVDKKNPYRDLDVRRKDVYEAFYNQAKAAPKSVLQRAEEAKENLIEVRLEESEKRLRSLLQFGEEMITNIRVSNERRELHRRLAEEKQKANLRERVTGESTEAISKLEDITAKWFELGEIEEPMTLYDNLEEQKKRFADVMASKDAVIARCQEEVDRINEAYTEELDRQAHDITCLVERVDNQIELMREAFAGQLQLLENTLEDERKRFSEEFQAKWHGAYKELRESDEQKFKYVREKKDFYDRELRRITVEQEEITRATRIRLEKDAEALERELRWTRNNVLLNSEKLDYNYQVLQKRNDENVIVNNQQKRRIARLLENISSIRKRIHTSQQVAELKHKKLITEINKLHASISELEKKAEIFKILNKKKFDKLWSINYKEVKELVLKVFEIDKILTEQQLGLPWEFPNVDLSDINAPEKDEQHDKHTEFDIMKDPFPCVKKPKPSKFKTFEKQEQDGTEMRLYRNILRRIADRSDFLLEDSVIEILEQYSEKDRNLVRIENVCTSLHITDMDMIKVLTKYFMPYTFCPNCQGSVSQDKVERLYSTKPYELSSQDDNTETKSNAPECSDHYLVMEPAFVLTALNDFTEFHVQKQNMAKAPKVSVMEVEVVNLIQMDDDTISKFWQKFFKFMPDEKQKVWRIMEHGLNHFVVVLKKREQLNNENAFLRKQNRELKYLLQKIVA